jgi:hypothetical protein
LVVVVLVYKVASAVLLPLGAEGLSTNININGGD